MRTREAPASCRISGHWSAWQALVAGPSMLAGTAVMLVLLGVAGGWEPLAILVWLACGATTLTLPGERVAVRLICRFRRLSPADAELLLPMWREVCDRCSVQEGAVGLYVQRSQAVNAYAVGSRSVAVTSKIVTSYRAGQINSAMLRGLLAHELGHHATRGARYTLATLWFAAPWRIFYRTLVRVCARLTGPQPAILLGTVATAVVGVALGQAARGQQWSTVVVLSALVVFGVLTPVADAAISRASEHAADRYAAGVGYGPDLARALAVLDPAHRQSGLLRLVDRHPRTPQRIDDLSHLRAGRSVRGLSAA